MTDIVNPRGLSRASVDSGYPSSVHDPEEVVAPVAEEPPKKKRKAWGQPVPEIKKLLPPRKRAKTEEEKEQRRAERIVRNRKAADKSRQRQKAAVAKLEVKTSRMQSENAALRAAIERYQTTFGTLDGVVVPPESLDVDDDDEPLEAHQLKEENVAHSSAPSPCTPNHASVADSPYSTTTTLVKTEPEYSPYMTFGDVSTHPLSIDDDDDDTTSFFSENALSGAVPFNGLTRYSAAITYDPQCQEPQKGTKLAQMISDAKERPRLSIFLLILHKLFTILSSETSETTLDTMNWTMSRVCRILAYSSQSSFRERVYLEILKNFPLIHSLITMPSTTTRPAVFRLKLLTSLLSCSPPVSQLLLAATSGALEEVVGCDSFAEDAGSRWNFSSLMAIKFAIMRADSNNSRKCHQIEVQRQTFDSIIKYERVIGCQERLTCRMTLLCANQKNDLDEHGVLATDLNWRQVPLNCIKSNEIHVIRNTEAF